VRDWAELAASRATLDVPTVSAEDAGTAGVPGDAGSARSLFDRARARAAEASCDVALLRRDLSDAVDSLGVLLLHAPLLGGGVARELRDAAAGRGDDDPVRIALEDAAAELWILGRASRPATELIELPEGEAPRRAP
jgi:hypothetical protein